MAFNAKIIVLRKDAPHINKIVGDVIDILPFDTFEGVEVNMVGKVYSRVYVSDLDEALADDLLSGVKRLIKPNADSQFYQELLANGYIETSNLTLLDYVEDVNA